MQSRYYKLNKHCAICGKPITDKNKSGYCHKHIDISGEKNPFYGKKHSNDTIEKLKISCAEATKKLWENEEYREKVIANATGLKRSDEFKETQRQNAFKQFEDPIQREIRSNCMKQSWENGVITFNPHIKHSRSKEEIDFMSELNKIYCDAIKTNQTIHYNQENVEHWLYPDGVFNNLIIEYNGSYWHADPRFYDDDFIIDGKKAKEIREWDNYKKTIYESLGYNVIYCWSHDYKNNKIEEMNKIIGFINTYLNKDEK